MATREDFFAEAQKLGITPQWAVDILRRNGIQENYNPEHHDRYMKLLRDHVAAFKRILMIVNKQEDMSHPLEKCPICGQPVERNRALDGKYGCSMGWKCISPDQGLPSHFFKYQLERIKPWMQRNQGMLDPETSSETVTLIECPSGVSQVEVSN